METISGLRRHILTYYQTHGRDLPWRQLADKRDQRFYQVWVSEMMLQQTQVPRVITKYQQWMQRFPDLPSVASATLSEVLTTWQGLGYNRRAKFVWQAAQLLEGKPLPQNLTELVSLPGIGVNTAAAVAVYCDDQPEVFIETNIRTIIIHHFFAGQEKVSEREITNIITALLPKEHVREWYWAMMDYGAYLKAGGNRSARQAVSYSRQSAFRGSYRELRGRVIRQLSAAPQTVLQLQTSCADVRLATVLQMLQHEGLIIEHHGSWRLP